MSSNSERVTMTQLLVPVVMMAFTILLLFGLQMSQIMRERDMLHQTIGRLESPFQEGQKLNNQFSGLVLGTQKLAEEGNKTAQSFVDRLKQMGIVAQPPQQGQPAPVPGATAQPEAGPVKP